MTASTFDREINLRDGTRVRMRPIRPDDEPRLVDLYGRLSRDTRYQRFFSVMQRLPPDWARFLANVDYTRRFALVMEHPPDPALIAVGRYEPSGDDPGVAELAVVVQDGWQGRGLGGVLMGGLLRAAASHGITRAFAPTSSATTAACWTSSAATPTSWSSAPSAESSTCCSPRRRGPGSLGGCRGDRGATRLRRGAAERRGLGGLSR